MGEIVDRPSPITLDQLKAKGEKYQQTGEIYSDVLDRVGKIPATDQLTALHFDMDEMIELRFPATDQGLQLRYQTYGGQKTEEVLEVPDDVIQATQPVINRSIEHFRRTLGISAATPLNGYFGLSHAEIHQITESDIHLPHTDDDLGHPEEHIRYVGSIGGAPMKIWKGPFNVPQNATVEDMYYELQNQINATNAPLIELQDGELVMIDSQTVHASPEFDLGQDPAQLGAHRYLISTYIELPVPM